MTIKTNAKKALEKPLARLGDAREGLGRVSEATVASSKAYVACLTELGRALDGFGREAAQDLGSHAKALLAARSLRSVVELQAGFIQSRAEATAAQTKEFADLAREKTEEVIAPISALIGADDKAAA